MKETPKNVDVAEAANTTQKQKPWTEQEAQELKELYEKKLWANRLKGNYQVSSRVLQELERILWEMQLPHTRGESPVKKLNEAESSLEELIKDVAYWKKQAWEYCKAPAWKDEEFTPWTDWLQDPPKNRD